MFDTNVCVALSQERERGVDQRQTSSRQITETELVVVVVEETRKGLRRPLADVLGGAEGKPRLGHALEAAQRPVGHPSEDLDEGTLGDAHRRLPLVLMPLPFLLCINDTKSLFTIYSLDRRLDRRGGEQT